MTEPIRPHPKNVEGPFYVEYGCCTACDVPMQEAPNHFTYDGDNHCFVCRQPETAAETTALIGTAWMAELQCIRYRGNDVDVLRRFAELDLRELCDIEPPKNIKPTIRNHVDLAARGPSPIASPQQLASAFVDYLHSQRCHCRANVSLTFEKLAESYHAMVISKLTRLTTLRRRSMWADNSSSPVRGWDRNEWFHCAVL